jgi:hypothetical protein
MLHTFSRALQAAPGGSKVVIAPSGVRKKLWENTLLSA